MPEHDPTETDAAPTRFAHHPEAVRADFTALLEHVLPQALRNLIRAEGFAPFAAAQTEMGPANVTPRDVRQAEAEGRLADALQTALRAGAIRGRHRATALVWDATAQPADGGTETDVIIARLDHRDGPSATAYVPYTPKTGGVEVEQVHIEEGAGGVFPAQMV